MSQTMRFSGWRIMALSTLVMGMTGPGQTIGVSVFIDHFSSDLGLSDAWVSGAYLVGTLSGSTALPSVGRWIDRYGVRHAMTVIAALFSLALVAMAGVQGLFTLALGFFFIRMLGQGSLSLVSTVAVSLWFERRRGMALGIAMTISGALMALVPVALDAAIGEVGWRGAWLIASGAVSMVVLPIAWFGMIDRPSDVGQVVDGTVPDSGQDPIEIWGIDRSAALATPAFWVLASATATMSMLSTGLNFHQISLLGESGFSSSQAAMMFIPQVLGTSIGSPGMGYALDRVGARLAPAIVLFLLVGVLLLAGSVSSRPMVIVYATCFGVAGGSVRTLGAAIIPKWFGTAHLGSIQGALSFFGVFASALGPFAFSLTEAGVGSYRTTATIWAVMPLALGILALRNYPPRRPTNGPRPLGANISADD